MSISLEEYKTNLRNVVRPNRFLCEVTPPWALQSDMSLEPELLKFHITSATLPDRQFGDIPLKYYGMTLSVPGNETIQDLNITVLMDSDWELRGFFETWANAINNRTTNEKAYMQELFEGAEVVVTQLGGNGEELAGYTFRHIYPKSVQEIELGMDNPDTVSMFQVTFGYSYWERVDKSETPDSEGWE